MTGQCGFVAELHKYLPFYIIRTVLFNNDYYYYYWLPPVERFTDIFEYL